VPFTSVHAGKYRTEDKLKIQTIQKLNTTQKKANNTKYSKTKLAWLSRLYDTRPGNEVGLFYTTPDTTQLKAREKGHSELANTLNP